MSVKQCLYYNAWRTYTSSGNRYALSATKLPHFVKQYTLLRDNTGMLLNVS